MIETNANITGYLWSSVSYSTKVLFRTINQGVKRVSEICDNVLDKLADGAKELGRRMPAHRDFSNFSTDPKFWETIFLNDLHLIFKKYGSNEKTLKKYIETWINASFTETSQLFPTHLIGLVFNQVKEIKDENLKNKLLETIARQTAHFPLNFIQTQKVLNVAKNHTTTHRETTPPKLSTLLLSGLMFSALIPQLRGEPLPLRENTPNSLINNTTSLDKNMNLCEIDFSTELQKTIRNASPKTLVDERFDIKSFLRNEGIMSYPKFSISNQLNPNMRYEHVYWSGLKVFHDLDLKNAKVEFVNNKFKGCLVSWNRGSHSLENSIFQNTTFSSDQGEYAKINNCLFVHSIYGVPPFHKTKSLTIKDSKFIESSQIYPNAKEIVKIKNSYFQNAEISEYLKVEFDNTILKNVIFGDGLSFLMPSASIKNSPLIEITAKDDSLLKIMNVYNVTRFSLNVSSNARSSYSISNIWNFTAITDLELKISNIKLFRSEFVNIGKLSGIWKKVFIPGDCKGVKTNLLYEKEQLRVKNVLLEDIIFEDAYLCEAKSERVFKRNLENLGFKLGRNVTMIDFSSTPLPLKFTASNDILIAAPFVLTGVLLLVITHKQIKHLFWFKS